MLTCLLILVLALLLAAVLRTLRIRPDRGEYVPLPQPRREAEYAQKLSKMVQFETVSVRGRPDPDKFRRFHGLLAELFPGVFAACEKTDLDGALILKWKGKSDENPILLLAHMDVVEASPEGWKYPPFSGAIAEGKVWGRGSGDTKGSLMALLQCAEELMAEGYVPACDVYLASGNTEEIGGDGGPKMAAWLKEQGVKLALLCDEGGAITDAPLAGLEGKYAMVGLFEKGYGDLRFIARSPGGHSSAPKKGSPIPQLAKFICAVEKKSPFRSEISPEVKAMFESLAPRCSFPLRLVLGNLWLFAPVLKKVIPMLSPQAAAMLHTTICFTMQKGSNGYNVIPQEASVCANLRYIPHQSTDESVALITKMAARYGLDTEIVKTGYPSKPLDLPGKPSLQTKAAIEQCFPGVCITPYVVVGGTDARFFGEVCDGCVRFSPLIYGKEQLAGQHGINENLETYCLPGAVDYYKTIVKLQEC